MTIVVHISEDCKKFPRMRADAPCREKGETPSVRLHNYALERYNDFVAAFRLHGRLTDAAEEGKVNRSPCTFRGLFRLIFADDSTLKDIAKQEVAQA